MSAHISAPLLRRRLFDVAAVATRRDSDVSRSIALSP